MRPRFALSLRARLLVPLLAMFVALAAGQTWHFLRERGELREEAATALLDRVKLIAARQHSLSAQAEAILNGLMARPELDPGADIGDCRREFAELLQRETAFVQMGRIDADGNLRCAAVPPPRPINHADLDWFQQSLRQPGLVVSDVMTGRILGKPLIKFAKAMRDRQGRMVGVFHLSLDLAWLERELAAGGLPEGARLIVLDGRGTVVALHPALPDWAGRNAAGLPLFQRIRAHGGEGTLEEVGLDGKRRLFGFTPFLKTVSGPMYLVLALPREAAEAPAQRNLLANLAIALGGLAAGLALLLLAAHRLLVRPLLALSRTAARLGAGDLDARSGLAHGDDEIGRLARTLDETGAALQDNLTEQRRNEEALRLAACVFHSTQEGVTITAADATILSVNQAFSDITGYAADEVVGAKPNLLRSDHHPPEFYRALWDGLARDGHWQGEIWNRRKGGDVYLQWTTISAVPGADGRPGRYVSVFHDITETRRKDERIRHLAFHDPLTGLPNRTLFQERLEHALARSRRENRRLSVTFIDLDGFKGVNDTLGHDVGDLLLQEIAGRIRARLRRGADTVARLGGDEFVVLMEDLNEAEQCASLAGEIIADIARPLTLRGHTVQVGASMGMAFFPEDGMDARELMQRADIAMYAAKQAGKGTYRFFRDDMLPRA